MKTMKILLGALVVLTALAGLGMADTVINANVAKSVEVSAPPSLDIGNLALGENDKALGSGISVSSNDANWQLKASSPSGYFANLANYNYLSLATSNGEYFGSGPSGDGSNVIANTEQRLAYGSSAYATRTGNFRKTAYSQRTASEWRQQC